MKKVTQAANLDKLLENFVLLEQKIAETQGRNNLLEIQLEEANRLVKVTQTKENCMKEGTKTLQELGDLVKEYHDPLILRRISNVTIQKRLSAEAQLNYKQARQLALSLGKAASGAYKLQRFLMEVDTHTGATELEDYHLGAGNYIATLKKDPEAMNITTSELMMEECGLLHGMITELQGTIQKQCDVRVSIFTDENEHLKKRIQDQDEKLKEAEQENKENVEKLLLEMKTMEKEHKVECAKIQQDLSRKFEIKEEELNGIIDKKETEIQLVNRQMRSQEREKQSEIIKLQMEFNTKLLKIQSTSKKSPHQDSSALPQNIFKRKLQHLQEEKNREIAALRRTIRELEQQRDCTQDLHLKRRRF
ncbi:uncharacterized protein LOC144495231 [Mustelus asterias]